MYVTLLSHANRQEFPHNQPNGFKNRLPHPLRLTDGNWEVGLSSISIPDTGLNLDHIVPVGEHVFWTTIVRKVTDIRNHVFEHQYMKMEDLKEDDSIVDGVSFMKAYIRWMQQDAVEDFKREYESSGLDNGKYLHTRFKWEGDDLVLDNSAVNRVRFRGIGIGYLMPHFAFNSVLAEKMGWMQKMADGTWKLGPNLTMVYHKNQIPRKGQYDFLDAEGNPMLLNSSIDKDKTLWFWPSFRLSWKFNNLNAAFHTMVKEPTRSLHVYSDVVGSSMVGNRTTDLLREINYRREGRGRIYFELQHIQYHPVRNRVLDIIEVQLAETTGEGEELVKFKPGHTLVTLHFKKME